MRPARARYSSRWTKPIPYELIARISQVQGQREPGEGSSQEKEEVASRQRARMRCQAAGAATER